MRSVARDVPPGTFAPASDRPPHAAVAAGPSPEIVRTTVPTVAVAPAVPAVTGAIDTVQRSASGALPVTVTSAGPAPSGSSVAAEIDDDARTGATVSTTTPKLSTCACVAGRADGAWYAAAPTLPASWTRYVPSGTTTPATCPSHDHERRPAGCDPIATVPTTVPSGRRNVAVTAVIAARAVQETARVSRLPSPFGENVRRATAADPIEAGPPPSNA